MDLCLELGVQLSILLPYIAEENQKSSYLNSKLVFHRKDLIVYKKVKDYLLFKLLDEHVVFTLDQC